MCSGGMRRYMEEHQWRRRLAGLQLTLRLESMGTKKRMTARSPSLKYLKDIVILSIQVTPRC